MEGCEGLLSVVPEAPEGCLFTELHYLVKPALCWPGASPLVSGGSCSET